MRGFQSLNGFEEHLRKPIDAPNLFAGTSEGERVLDGVESPVNHGMAIKEHQEWGFFHRK
jgi:hypothetical protein